MLKNGFKPLNGTTYRMKLPEALQHNALRLHLGRNEILLLNCIYKELERRKPPVTDPQGEGARARPPLLGS